MTIKMESQIQALKKNQILPIPVTNQRRRARLKGDDYSKSSMLLYILYIVVLNLKRHLYLLFKIRRPNSKEGADTCVTDDTFEDGVGKFERAGNQRSSIAERRRMYEGRSVSVQETTSTGMIAATAAAVEANQSSPTPIRYYLTESVYKIYHVLSDRI